MDELYNYINRDEIEEYTLNLLINNILKYYKPNVVKDVMSEIIQDLKNDLIYLEVEDSYSGETSLYSNQMNKIEIIESVMNTL